MISGTSKISLNIDPIDHQIWARGLHIYGFYYAKNTSQHIRKFMGTSWKHIIFVNIRLIFHFFSKVCVPLFLFEYIIFIIFYEDEDRH